MQRLIANGHQLLLLAAALTSTVNAALFVGILASETSSLNLLNLASLLGTTLAVAIVVWSTPKKRFLLLGYLLFVASFIPTTFGWIGVLYIPSLLILTGVLLSKSFSYRRTNSMSL